MDFGVKHSFKQKLPQQQDLNIPNMSAEQFQALSKMFSEPSCSSNEEYAKVVSLLGQKPQMPLEVQYDMILVNDDMTTKELIKKWYDHQFSNKKNKKQPEDYVIMYESEQTKFALYDQLTIMDFKQKIGVQKLPHDLYLIVYEHQHCRFHQTQSAMGESDFIDFEIKQKKIDIPIKVIINFQRGYYFYIETTSTSITFSQLDKKIKQQLTSNKHPIKCEDSIKYTLSVQKEISLQSLQKKLKQEKISLKKYWKDNRLMLDMLNTQIRKLGVRKLCSPGQIIQLDFLNHCFDLDFPAAANDCEIRIHYYEKIDEDKQIKNTAKLRKKPIIKNYSEISKMKISTLLKEHKIEEPLTTCLYLNGAVIRPMVKFEQIQQIKALMKAKKLIYFVCLSDNFVFYQQLAQLAHQNKNTTIDELLNEFQSKKSIVIEQKKRQNYTSLRKAKEVELKAASKVKEQHKKVRFFDPIMLYTSNLIYWQLNETLRKTSICLFLKQKVLKDCWNYKISQRIITNLMELDNFRGTVYRGTGSYDYNYKAGTIVQWCCFTSTSVNKQKAAGFSGGKYPYLFEIKTFTGKSISYFSQFKTQSEILIMPHTKFYVVDIQVVPKKYTCVKILELPVPKKIPGHAVVWVDNNLEQNYDNFQQIKMDLNLKNFDLIQLQSNEHLIHWLHAYKHLLDIPHMKLHFITNMNRNLQRKKEGIDTLEIIRSFDKTTPVVFYIYDIESKKKDLKERGKDKDENVFVIESPSQLRNVFISYFLSEQERYQLAKNYKKIS